MSVDTVGPDVAASPADVVAELRRREVVDVDDSSTTRALYSTDASLYRVVPQVVVRPRSVEEVLAVLDASRATGVPVTSRGAGTSIAGNAVGTGIVVDFAKHLNRVHEVDVERRVARVDPGIVHAALQKVAAPQGLRFGPDPSTHTRCTVGGMIGNNACGNRALGYGRSSDNVAALDVVTGTGERLTIGRDVATTSPTSSTRSGCSRTGSRSARSSCSSASRSSSSWASPAGSGIAGGCWVRPSSSGSWSSSRWSSRT
uniref:FAD-binding oxidoreductase n=1 Tax=Aeromicrobium sp. REDSEA-S32_B7 TaxID=1811526 RepID=UPI000B0E374E